MNNKNLIEEYYNEMVTIILKSGVRLKGQILDDAFEKDSFFSLEMSDGYLLVDANEVAALGKLSQVHSKD